MGSSLSQLQLSAVTGRVNAEQCSAIAQLYGSVDTKYADPAFVQHQFIENRAGWSVHVFVADESDKYVGHCAVIPVSGVWGRRALLTGKVEALYLAPNVRTATLNTVFGPRPAAVAILQSLYAAAERAGIDVVHAVGTDEVGVLHRMAGCSRLRRPLEQFVFTQDRGSISKWARGYRRHAVAVAADAYGLVARAAASVVARTTITTQPAAIEQFANVTISLSENEWTVDSREILRWQAEAGRIAVVRVAGRLGSEALVAQPAGEHGPIQLLAWQSESTSSYAALRAVLALIGLAARRRSRLILRDLDDIVGGTAVRRVASRVLPCRHAEMSLYVRWRAGLAAPPPTLHWTPLLYASF